MCVSAITGAGLNTVDLSSLNTFQQLILFFLIIVGSPIIISSTVLYVRKRAFESKFKGISQERARSRHNSVFDHQARSDIDLPSYSRPGNTGAYGGDQCDQSNSAAQTTPTDPTDLNHIHWVGDDQITIGNVKPRCHHHRVFPMAGVGARKDLNNDPRDVPPNHSLYDETELAGFKGVLKGTQKFILASKAFISRNSQFHGLTPEEREELGGVEYRAVSFLSIIVPLYFFSFLILGAIGVGSWLTVNRPRVAQDNGLSPFFTGAFFAVSAFGNSGMALLDANMTALQTNAYPLITMGMLILAGNTLYPCFLRFIIWGMRRLLPKKATWDEWKITLDFILKHPRRVYTNLFPARHTWYLLGTIVILNGIDWAGFEILSIGNNEIDSLPTGYRVLDGLFQALAVRSGGFYVVTISKLRQGLLVLYVLMMYVSAFPVLITIRNTNVYEERSLGIYAHDDAYDQESSSSSSSELFMALIRQHLLGRSDVPTSANESSRGYFVRQQVRSQLSHDIWLVAVAVLFISIAESSNYNHNPMAFSTFNIIFEAVSAYGCVGISVGFPGKNYSFCGAWHTISKLILAAVALRGRHRGLPVAVDRAVMLPSEWLAWAEEEDAALRSERSRTWGADRMPVGAV